MCLGIKKLDQSSKIKSCLRATLAARRTFSCFRQISPYTILSIQEVLKQLFLLFYTKTKINPFPFKAQVLLCKPIFGADHTGTWTEVFLTSYIAPPRPLTEICIDFHLALKQNLAQNVNPLSSEQKNPIFKSPQNKIQNVNLKKYSSEFFSSQITVRGDPKLVSIALRNHANAKPLANHFSLKNLFFRYFNLQNNRAGPCMRRSIGF